MTTHVKEYTKKIKNFMRRTGVADIFSQGYDEVSDQMTMDEYSVQCWILFMCEYQKKSLDEACRGMPKEFLWIKRKHRWGKFHIALQIAMNHNKKIDTIRQNIKMESLQNYSHSIQPIRSCKPSKTLSLSSSLHQEPPLTF